MKRRGSRHPYSIEHPAVGGRVTREQRLTQRYTRAEAAVKRTEARLARAFRAWDKARVELARVIKALEADPPTRAKGGPDPDLNDSL